MYMVSGGVAKEWVGIFVREGRRQRKRNSYILSLCETSHDFSLHIISEYLPKKCDMFVLIF